MADAIESGQGAVRDVLRDVLTGLPGRSLVLDRLETSLQENRRTGQCLAVASLRCEHPGGPQATDRAVMEVAARVLRLLREGDTLARWGRQEFVVLWRGLQQSGEAQLLAARLALVTDPPLWVAGFQQPVTLRVGVVECGDAESAEQLVHAAQQEGVTGSRRDRSVGAEIAVRGAGELARQVNPAIPVLRSGPGHAVLGDIRDLAAEHRDAVAAHRDRLAADHDGHANGREQAAQLRRLAGARRDQQARLRDRAADLRDRVAGVRDRSPAALPARESAVLVEGLPSEAGAIVAQLREALRSERAQAAKDRAASAADREAAGRDRERGRLDRLQAANDRGLFFWEGRLASDWRGRAAQERELAAHDRRAAQGDRRAAAEERRQAAVDGLTGVQLRAAGFAALTTQIAAARRAGQELVACFVDVDGLKRVNDTSGHAAGDRLLLVVARTLVGQLRVGDVILRYGGDEFVCTLRGLTEQEAAQRLSGVNALLAAGAHGGSVTIGLAQLRADDTAETLVARADASLYLRRQQRAQTSA